MICMVDRGSIFRLIFAAWMLIEIELGVKVSLQIIMKEIGPDDGS